MFDIIGQLIVGLVVGVIARLIMPGKEALPDGALGWLLTAVLGIAGALVGTLLGGVIFGANYPGAGWIMSIIGALILLFIFRMIMGKSGSAG